VAFENLKEDLTKVAVLGILDFAKVFVVETDASTHGIGGVLM